MAIHTEIAITQSTVYFIAGDIPMYLTFIAKTKIGKDDKHFKRLTIVFASSH
ncbi:MAG TPA: hypothetical protein VEL11_00820 [Candidatus Bathyarchaeia archaeon]|nr:hypothetical protein [Candidatus Bathyarchaeia archaeon]